MPIFHLPSSIITIFLSFFILLQLPLCSTHKDSSQYGDYKIIKENSHRLSPEMKFSMKLHGFLLWASVGLLMPIGILTIRMSSKQEGGRRARVFFYLHAIIQTVGVLLATAGAVMSIKNFENSFNNSHQRIGLALYVAMWLQGLIGFYRPRRGTRKRSTWYCVHWMLGTIISLMGIINIYTGLRAYNNRTAKSTRIWTILFTAEVSFLAMFYLFQDKWEYMQKQAIVISDNDNELQIVPATTTTVQPIVARRDNQIVLFPQPFLKRNALRNLFDN